MRVRIRTSAALPSAAYPQGSRFRGDIPKQYWMLEGKPVLVHSLERLAAAFPLQQAYVAVTPGDRWYDETIGASAGRHPSAVRRRDARRNRPQRALGNDGRR